MPQGWRGTKRTETEGETEGEVGKELDSLQIPEEKHTCPVVVTCTDGVMFLTLNF